MTEKNSGNKDPPKEDYIVCVQLPWCNQRLEVSNDREMLGVFEMFKQHKQSRIVFEVEFKPYTPLAAACSSSTLNDNVIPLPYDNYESMRFSDFEDDLLDSFEYNEEPNEPIEPNDDLVVRENSEDEDESLKAFEGYISNDDDVFYNDSEDESDIDKLNRLLRGKPFVQLENSNIKFEVDQTFDFVYVLRAVLKEYAIQEGVNLNRVKNDKDRILYKCKGLGCPWRLYASCLEDGHTFMVKTYIDEHDCHRTYKSGEAKAKWIASKFEDLVKCNPDIKVGVISDLLREKYHVNVDVQRLYKAKKRALDGLGVEHRDCFKYLRQYAYMVNQTNPGSIAYIRMQQPEPTFQRFVLSFDAQRKGFLTGCRPFIGLDGCHLKGPYKGILLSAVALDANSGLYPLAVCICEQESTSSWNWFLGHLSTFLDYPNDQPLCFMSDRQKGVMDAIQVKFPFASTRFCARHIYANFRQQHSGAKLKNLFWQASRSSETHEFFSTMTAIKEVNEDAWVWLSKIEAKQWSRHGFDVRIKCDHVTNNMTESFNSMLGLHRAKNFLQLLEHIRRMVMKKYQERKDDCRRWTIELPPTIRTKIVQYSKQCRLLKVIAAGDGEFEVVGPTRTYICKLKHNFCQCGVWQLSGVPCPHVLAAISEYDEVRSVTDRECDKVIQFVHSSLTKNAYLRTYESMTHPILDRQTWPQIGVAALIPPPVIKHPGRPKVARRREPGERQKETRRGSVVCNKCGTVGHNKRTCKGDITSSSNSRTRATTNKKRKSSIQLSSHNSISCS